MSFLDSALGYVLGVVLASLTVTTFLRPQIKNFAKEILRESIQEALKDFLNETSPHKVSGSSSNFRGSNTDNQAGKAEEETIDNGRNNRGKETIQEDNRGSKKKSRANKRESKTRGGAKS